MASLGILVAPSLLLLQLTAAYALVGWSCASGQGWVIHAVLGVTLVTAACIALGALLRLRQALRAQSEGGEFAARLAVAMSILVCLVVIAQWIPAALLSPCD